MSCSLDSVYNRTANLHLKSLHNINNILKIATKCQEKKKIDILVWRQAYKQELLGTKPQNLPFTSPRNCLKQGVPSKQMLLLSAWSHHKQCCASCSRQFLSFL